MRCWSLLALCIFHIQAYDFMEYWKRRDEKQNVGTTLWRNQYQEMDHYKNSLKLAEELRNKEAEPGQDWGSKREVGKGVKFCA